MLLQSFCLKMTNLNWKSCYIFFRSINVKNENTHTKKSFLFVWTVWKNKNIHCQNRCFYSYGNVLCLVSFNKKLWDLFESFSTISFLRHICIIMRFISGKHIINTGNFTTLKSNIQLITYFIRRVLIYTECQHIYHEAAFMWNA